MAVYEELPIDEAFSRNYEIDWLVDMPSSSFERYDFDNAGPILRVKSGDGKKFIVTVPGDASELRIATWPNPDAFFTFPGAVLVNTLHPERSEALPGFEGHSAHYAFPIPSRGIILIGHCCGIYCYDHNGLRWDQNGLFCCEDPVIDVIGETLVLLAHKHGEDPGDQPVRKYLSLASGQRVEPPNFV